MLAILSLEFHLPGCQSLKQKRHRLHGLRDRFGKSPQIAVIESDYADSLERGQWSFVVVAANRRLAEQQLQTLIQGVQDFDAVLCDQRIEWL